MPKFAANISLLFNELDFLDRFAAARRVGFEAVEFLFPYRYPAAEIKRRLDDAGLQLVLFNLAPGDWENGERGIATQPGREAEFREALAIGLGYAVHLGCPQCHVMSGIRPEGIAPATVEATYLENLRFAADRAAELGVRLLIEPLNSRDLPGYVLTGTDQARRIIEAVGSDNLFLQYDGYHMQIMQGDHAETLRRNMDIIRHIQVSNVPDRTEPDVGEIDYPYLFDLIDELGYAGWIGCEYRPRAGTLEGLGWAKPYGITATSG